MLEVTIRKHRSVAATIANGGNLSDAFDARKVTMGTLHMPAAWTSASIGFKVSPTSDGTFLPLYDEHGTLVQITSPSASQAYSLPTRLAGCGFVKLWSQDGSGSNTAQGAARSFLVELKS